MKVTRDVIYDLLPAYFAGEISADSKALIDEFFTTDPEFGRMAERFRLLHEESRLGETAESESEASRERETFDRAKTRIQRRQAAMMWGAGAVMALGMAGFRRPGVFIGIVFAVVAVATWFSSTQSGGWAAGMSDEWVPVRRRSRKRE